MNAKPGKNKAMKLVLAAALILGLAFPASAAQQAVSATAAADFSSGATAVISVDQINGVRTAQTELLPTISDIIVRAQGEYFYRVERFMGDNITRFHIDAPTTPLWQYSTMDADDTVSSNPHDLVFAGEKKAYMLRYGKDKVWIVNPSADSEGDFKIGELDLSAYADEDGIPEAHAGVVVGNRLFIVMQRLNRNDNWAPGTAYLAVFDIFTDEEINVGAANDLGVPGLALPMTNPDKMQYLPDTGLIYISFWGRFASSYSGTPAEYDGGILSLNPRTLELTTVLDDGDEDSHPVGNVFKMEIVSADKGYLVGYAGSGDNTLYAFNPATGALTGAVSAGLTSKNLGALSSDQNGCLWVGNGTDARYEILNPADDSVDEQVGTSLNPIDIAFAETAPHTIYLPYLAAGEGVWTGLGLRNMSATGGADVKIYGYDQGGNLRFVEPLAIPARGQSALVAGQGVEVTGWLKITSSQSLGGLSFVGATGGNDYMVDMPLTETLSDSLVIPHLAQNAEWDTTVMIANPSAAAATVTLTVVNAKGVAVKSESHEIAAAGSGVYALSDLLVDMELPCGSVDITSTQGVTAFALYSNMKNGGHSYAGVSAVSAK
ncbi:MAG: hypothetical protein CR990_00440 [Desulfococcus sp.]|nr:MAG: hypothetical protein CR990_00440 [Desulfococcus sp.]